VQSRQRVRVGGGRHHGDAAQRLGVLRQRGQQQAVVGAQKTGLHQHAAPHAQRPGGGLPCCQGRGIGRRVARAGLSLVRVEHMKVAVHRRF
jgi:hypothetical protein